MYLKIYYISLLLSLSINLFFPSCLLFSYVFINIAIAVEKKAGETFDYNKMKVKDLKKILDQRNVKCAGCTEKTEFVKKCETTEHLEM